MESSIFELWTATGPLARAVVVLLTGMSLAATAVAAEKWLRLRHAERADASFLAAWRAGASTPAEVAELAARYPTSAVATLVRDLVVVPSEPDAGSRRELHDRVVRRRILAAEAELRGGLGVVATVGSTAPFVGLFGTVVGIINAFRAIGAAGHGGVGTVSTGIAEALVTTAFGIMVAIPAVWLFNHLTQRIGRHLAALEAAAEEAAIERLTAESGSPTARAGSASWR